MSAAEIEALDTAEREAAEKSAAEAAEQAALEAAEQEALERAARKKRKTQKAPEPAASSTASSQPPLDPDTSGRAPRKNVKRTAESLSMSFLILSRSLPFLLSSPLLSPPLSSPRPTLPSSHQRSSQLYSLLF